MAIPQPTTDHGEIRRWVRQRNGNPARVSATGAISIDFDGSNGEGNLEAISWDEWFETFEEQKLALRIDPEASRDRLSTFYEFVSRDRIENE
jgi:hypothetical protein